MEYRIFIECVQTVGDVQVVTDVGVGVVRIAIPSGTVQIGLTQFTRILTSKICDCDSSRVACIDLREGVGDNLDLPRSG